MRDSRPRILAHRLELDQLSGLPAAVNFRDILKRRLLSEAAPESKDGWGDL
jgi:hypothetical protein